VIQPTYGAPLALKDKPADKMTLLRAVYAHLNVEESKTKKWNAESTHYARSVGQMTDRHLINAICLAYERSSGAWPLPLKMYPSLLALIKDAADKRGLGRPRALEGSDWPWESKVKELDTFNALVQVDVQFEVTAELSEARKRIHAGLGLGLDSAIDPDLESTRTGPSKVFQESDPRDHRNARDHLGRGWPVAHKNTADEKSEGAPMSKVDSHSADPQPNQEKEKFLATFQKTFKEDFNTAKASAVYGATLAMLDDALKPYEVFLPDWMKTEEFKAALIWIMGSVSFAGLEQVEGDMFLLNLGRSLARNSARGAAAHFGMHGGEKAYQLSKKVLAALNVYLRPKGYGINMGGDIIPAHQLPDNGQLDELSQQMADMTRAMNEMRAAQTVQAEEITA
jgi:hypothetical protein